MRKKFALQFLAMVVPVLSALGQTYRIDPSHTSITTKVMRFGVVKVVGRFTNVSGNISYNAEEPAKTKADIVVKADSYTANNPEGEKAVKGQTFLDAATFPEIKVAVKGLVKAANGFIVTADLTLHGVTKQVSFSAVINGPALDLPTNKQSIGISASLTINRQDFGMTMAGKLPNGATIIGNEVEIEINALALAQ
jgi:polyisoprenoid-binding protein YceI